MREEWGAIRGFNPSTHNCYGDAGKKCQDAYGKHHNATIYVPHAILDNLGLGFLWRKKMNTLFKLLSVLILLSITGCDISNIDKLPPGEVYGWLKPGANFTEIGKALLECDMPSLID